jgi:hypothetical protein
MQIYARIVDNQAALSVQFANSDPQNAFLLVTLTAEFANPDKQPESVPLVSWLL